MATLSASFQQALACLQGLGIPSFHEPSFCTTAAQLEQAAKAPAGDFKQRREDFEVTGGYAADVGGQTLVNGPLALSYLAFGANGYGVPALRSAMVNGMAAPLAESLKRRP